MTDAINYEKLYSELIEALGYDTNAVKDHNSHEKVIKVAKILRRVAVTMQTSTPETSGALFVCGFGGKTDSMGLPEHINICPTSSMAGSAVYTKTREYSEPGW